MKIYLKGPGPLQGELKYDNKAPSVFIPVPAGIKLFEQLDISQTHVIKLEYRNTYEDNVFEFVGYS